MVGWISARQALERVPNFFRKRGKNAWRFDRYNRRWYSQFGFAELRVQLNRAGDPDFDRVVVGEAPNINAVVFGRDAEGLKIAVVTQDRPFADHPETGKPADPPFSFRQPCVMGFAKRLLGNTLGEAFEKYGEAGIREAAEEAGALGVLNVKDLGWHNPNPTFCASWSKVLLIEVDLTQLTSQIDRSELITKATFEPLSVILEAIDSNNGFQGSVSSRAATPNSALLIAMAHMRKEWLGM